MSTSQVLRERDYIVLYTIVIILILQLFLIERMKGMIERLN